MIARSLRIVLVDDEPDILLLLQTMLRAASWEVVGRASNGNDALRIAGEINPDVAIVDYSMPGMNGLELTAHLKDLLPNCTIIIFSAFDVEEESLAGGADLFLSKTHVNHLLPLLEEIAAARDD